MQKGITDRIADVRSVRTQLRREQHDAPMSPANRRRAGRVQALLQSYRDGDPHAEESQHVTDLLCDMRHYAQLRNLNLEACDRMAQEHYLVERQYE